MTDKDMDKMTDDELSKTTKTFTDNFKATVRQIKMDKKKKKRKAGM